MCILVLPSHCTLGVCRVRRNLTTASCARTRDAVAGRYSRTMATASRERSARSAAAGPATRRQPSRRRSARGSARSARRPGFTVRGLAARTDVSPSLISQIELGRATPSVATLWAVATELGHPDRRPLQQGRSRRPVGRSGRPSACPARTETRKAITLAGGVRWERLTPGPDDEVEFIYIVYPVGVRVVPARRPLAARWQGVRLRHQRHARRADRLRPATSCTRTTRSASSRRQPHRLWAIGDESGGRGLDGRQPPRRPEPPAPISRSAA